jgi:hypothetical protein
MKQIQLTHGCIALVDDCDFELVSRYKWYAIQHENNRWYAGTQSESVPFHMHRLILGFPNGMDIDHKNGDGLDNRRENLRPATRSQNNANQQITPHTSKYKGVCWDKNREKWFAKLKTNHKTNNLGRFDNEEDAARAYNRKALEIFGEFARLNPVEEKI